MSLKLNGKPLEMLAIPRGVLRIKAFLEKLPDNELLDSRQLAVRAGYSTRVISSNYGPHDALKGLRAKIRYPSVKVAWGNSRTIKELSKRGELLV